MKLTRDETEYILNVEKFKEALTPACKREEIILLTGTNGFIGGKLLSHFIDNREKYQIKKIVLFLRSEPKQADLPDWVTWSKSLEDCFAVDPTKIFHFAASTYRGAQPEEEIIRNNLELTLRIWGMNEVGSQADCFIASTYTKESPKPSLYDASKKALETLALPYSFANRFLIIPDIYGGDDERPKIWNLLQEAVDNRECEFEYRSTSNQTIFPLHVKDLVQMIGEVGFERIGTKKIKKIAFIPESVKLLQVHHHFAGKEIQASWGYEEIIHPVGEIVRNSEIVYFISYPDPIEVFSEDSTPKIMRVEGDLLASGRTFSF